MPHNDPVLLGVIAAAILIAALLSWLLGRRNASPHVDPGLTEELRRSLASAQDEAHLKDTAHQEELVRATTLETRLAETLQRHTEAEQRHAENLAAAHAEIDRIRAEYERERATLEQRHSRDLEELKNAFAKMSGDVLRGMTPDVTKEVATKVEPLITQINTTLFNYQQALQNNLTGQTDLLTQVREQMIRVGQNTADLTTSTNEFTAVLKSSQHRGRWGEQTLRRVVEASGLSSACDFIEQDSQSTSRPDLVVRLPHERCIIIDSKVPEFDAALANHAAPNRQDLVRSHARKLRETLLGLAAKNYPADQRKAGRTPFEHVILFLPAESLLSTALEGDQDLVLDAAKHNILLATPATLIGFLSAINLAWQQHQQVENASKIAGEALNLYERVQKLVQHLSKLRAGMESTSSAFNEVLGSYERRVRPTGEALRKLGVASTHEPLATLDDLPTQLRIPRGEEGAEPAANPS